MAEMDGKIRFFIFPFITYLRYDFDTKSFSDKGRKKIKIDKDHVK